MWVCVCIYFTHILGYLIRTPFIPQIAKLDHGKNKNLFDYPLQVNKIKYGTTGFKKQHNESTLLITHGFLKSHAKHINSDRIILNCSLLHEK